MKRFVIGLVAAVAAMVFTASDASACGRKSKQSQSACTTTYTVVQSAPVTYCYSQPKQAYYFQSPNLTYSFPVLNAVRGTVAPTCTNGSCSK